MSEKTNNDSLENELDTTRVKISELTKGMTSQERAEYLNKRAREITSEQGLDVCYVSAPVIRYKKDMGTGSAF